ncbi:protein of unknown function [Nitrosotalea devaniterrae]|uniref:Uncharacterized protein n=1 Tax=Nitrosotalea devaniterrae TaxID=1078905 RepID=A0A128A226_9ARCH|nr:protein of unknown function [Candidatus Nitrosotalea devanaterra]
MVHIGLNDGSEFRYLYTHIEAVLLDMAGQKQFVSGLQLHIPTLRGNQ